MRLLFSYENLWTSYEYSNHQHSSSFQSLSLIACSKFTNQILSYSNLPLPRQVVIYNSSFWKQHLSIFMHLNYHGILLIIHGHPTLF